MNKLFVSLALAVVAAPVWAATQTITLSVPGMTCAACPLTVKAALSKVEGVSKTTVVFDKREATVTFDNAKTSAQALMRATGNAGYPSTLKN
ncbi:mercury resistance system periplasmic binding protein MerP [Paralcaligenes ureilyticus]|uniref:Periplasmic mercury ion-binding protein n=1 Tax=Paralcaligenes ureilyticus TaxID=627131 RepID=A0A4R3M1P7_9BURK|nr:mercury resistance system periplasmic binding protein MerP [Paralcaligenes ureilyticus]TCT07051.1 mercuric ion binding protein [Paralcaligenes ureilyticus]